MWCTRFSEEINLYFHKYCKLLLIEEPAGLSVIAALKAFGFNAGQCSLEGLHEIMLILLVGQALIGSQS